MWENIKLNEVQDSKPEFSDIKEGTVTAQLTPTAHYRDRNGRQELVLRATIQDGDDLGRVIFMQYPDPESTYIKDGVEKKMAFSAQQLKKLQVSLGTDPLDGEDPAAFINRTAANGHSRFKITLAKGNYIPPGQVTPRVEPNLWSVAPAA